MIFETDQFMALEIKELSSTVGLMYFSPSGTASKICEEIAASIGKTPPIRLDLTRPNQSARYSY